MSTMQATAASCSNIALIKYWGNRDQALRLPSNSSLSMNLDALVTTTMVRFDAALPGDEVSIDGEPVQGRAAGRVSAHLDRVRALAGLDLPARVVSSNNFPAGAGLASSASAFAALTLAACAAAGLRLSESELSRLARRASGSACRSVPGGFVEWDACDEDECSYGRAIAPADHWDLSDVIAIIETAHKAVGSSEGHGLAASSPLHAARVEAVPEMLARCRAAVLARDLAALAPVVEQDALAMHAVMMTGMPSLLYWTPPTLAVMQAVRAWRAGGLPVAFTVDAGPNVHCLCPAGVVGEVEQRLRAVPGVKGTLTSQAGGPARLIS
jgi:diphosphomevalonate decarboxylase